jgi:parvulin-like peptidyl-prolyl isomerase
MALYKGKELKPEIEEPLFALSVGDVAAPQKIEDRYYVFKLQSVAAPAHQSLADAQERIQTFLFNTKMQDALQKWLNELKKKSYIRIL